MGKVFITGGTGQVGSHLVEYLLKTKKLGIRIPQDILCLVRNNNTADHLKKLHVTIIEGNLTNHEVLTKIFQEEEISSVFHIAANVYVYSSYEEMYETNVLGTRELLKCFVQSRALNFIHTSSIIVYNPAAATSFNGEKNNYEFTERSPTGTLSPDRDVPYAITKRIAESEVKEFARSNPKKRFIITRLGPIIGAKDRQILPSLVKAFSLKLPKLINHGKGFLSLTAPMDVARAQVFLVEHQHKNSLEIYNVTNTHLSYLTLFTIIAKYYNKDAPSFSIPLWIFKSVKPILRLLKYIFPKNKLIQTFFSSTALEYFEKTYHYNSDKLLSTGFRFQTQIKDAILEGVTELDPEKHLIN